MKIGVVFAGELSYSRGDARKTLAIINELGRLGHEVTIISGSEPSHLRAPSKYISIDQIPKSYSRSVTTEIKSAMRYLLRTGVQIFAAVVGGDFDVVLVHSGHPTSVISAVMASILSRKEITYDARDLVPEGAMIVRGWECKGMKYWLLRAYEKFIVGKASDVLVVSDVIKKAFLKYAGSNKIYVLYNLLERDTISQENDDVYTTDRKQTLELIYVGEMQQKLRGIETILEGLHKIIETGFHDIKLHLVGGGSGLKEFMAMSDSLGIQDYVVFHGEVPHDEVLKILSNVHIAVLPYPRGGKCFWETDGALPAKLLEYMGRGKIIVASNLAQARIAIGKWGYFFKPGQPEDFAETVLKASSERERFLDVSKNVRKRAMQYVWEDAVQILSEVFPSE